MNKTFKPLLAAVLILVAGCDFQAAQDAAEQLRLKIGLEPINTVLGVGVVDATTGDFIPNARVTFMGAGASAAVNVFSRPITGLDLDDGVASFGITNATVPSTSSPYSVTVNASAPGYSSGSAVLTRTETGYGYVLVPLVAGGQDAMSLHKQAPEPFAAGISQIYTMKVTIFCPLARVITPEMTQASADGSVTWYRQRGTKDWAMVTDYASRTVRPAAINTEFTIDVPTGSRVDFKTIMGTSQTESSGNAPSGNIWEVPVPFDSWGAGLGFSCTTPA